MPMSYKFTFPPNLENVFIDVRSNDQFCTMVSVQSFDCPIYDVNEIGTRQGHYQTMASIASFNVDVSREIGENRWQFVHFRPVNFLNGILFCSSFWSNPRTPNVSAIRNRRTFDPVETAIDVFVLLHASLSSGNHRHSTREERHGDSSPTCEL